MTTATPDPERQETGSDPGNPLYDAPEETPTPAPEDPEGDDTDSEDPE